MNIEFQREMESYEGIDFNKSSFSVNGDLSLISWLPFGFYFQTGHSIFYDPEDPFLGWSNIYGLSMTLKPSKRLRVGISYSKQTLREKRGGKLVFDYNVIRSRTTYQLSKSFSLRAIIDYNHFDNELYGSFLVSYVYRPGTVFFFGIDNNLVRDNGGVYGQENYSVFVKFSYWWRI
jgi:hypothetical protein